MVDDDAGFTRVPTTNVSQGFKKIFSKPVERNITCPESRNIIDMNYNMEKKR
jgi:hypothetical protein